MDVREDMDKLLAEIQASLGEACASAQCAVEFGKPSSAAKMIIGTIGQLGAAYSMTLKLVDVESGAADATVEEHARGSADDIFNLVDLCGARLIDEYAVLQLRRLGLPPPRHVDRASYYPVLRPKQLHRCRRYWHRPDLHPAWRRSRPRGRRFGRTIPASQGGKTGPTGISFCGRALAYPPLRN